jgi:hypothetical protein
MTTKKHTSLAEQVKQAQTIVSGWSEAKRSSLHLDGVDVFLNRKSHRRSWPLPRPSRQAGIGPSASAGGPCAVLWAGPAGGTDSVPSGASARIDASSREGPDPLQTT